MAAEVGLRRNSIERGDEKFDPPPGCSDESSQEESNDRRNARPTKNKEPSRFGDPIKYSVKEVSTDSEVKETHGRRLKETLTNYPMK